MASIFEQQGYFELANEYLAEAMKIAEKAGYEYLVGGIYNEQAWVYYRSLNFKIALDNNVKAEVIFKKLNVDLELAGCWDLRGLVERNLGHNDTALYYHEKSLALRTDLKTRSEISDGNFNLGEFYLKTGKFKTALSYYFKSIAIGRVYKTTNSSHHYPLPCGHIGCATYYLQGFGSTYIYSCDFQFISIRMLHTSKHFTYLQAFHATFYSFY